MAAKRILIVGGTGAQGFAVAQGLLAASERFIVRVLSRDPDSKVVKEKFKQYPQVEFHKGSFMDFAAVESALQDCYGVYVNTDSYSVNERDELWAGVRIFEIANTIPTLRHFVYSSIDYYLRLTNFDHTYAAHHTNGKGRVETYLNGLTSPAHPDSNVVWTTYITGVYNEDLMDGPCTPHIEDDGTVAFKLPLKDGRIPFQPLKDCATFAVHIFQNREAWSGKTLRAVSHFATGQEIAETLQRVAGVKSRYEHVPIEKWLSNLPGGEKPMAKTDPEGISLGDNFAMWWVGFQDSILLKHGRRDFSILKQIHPGLQSLEDWMRETKWDGEYRPILKGLIDDGIGAKDQQFRSWA